MTTKISLDSLKDSDYKALLENDKVVDELIEFTAGSGATVDDWLDLLDGLNDYSLGGSYDHNYMVVNNSYTFLQSVLVAQLNYNVLPDGLPEKIEKSLSEYEDSEPSSDFDDKLNEVSEKVADELVKVAKNEVDYLMSEPYLLDIMKNDEALTIIYGEDAYYNREDNKIYYTCAD